MKLALLLLVISGVAQAQQAPFDIKGYTTGVAVSSIDKSACKAVAHVDSGMGGFVCQTTIGGAKAEVKLAVFENQVASVLANIPSGDMEATRDALVEKYGQYAKPNTYLDDYYWRSGERHWLFVKRPVASAGFEMMLIDFELVTKARAAAAQKAKKDI